MFGLLVSKAVSCRFVFDVYGQSLFQNDERSRRFCSLVIGKLRAGELVHYYHISAGVAAFFVST